MNKAFAAIKQAAVLLRRHPWVALPFVILAITEGIVLYLLFLAPQQPFASLLAPPIERFYGERYVHYPWHLLKLPELFFQCKMLLSLLPGMFLSAVLVGLVGDIQLSKRPTFWKHLNTSAHRFFTLLCIWLLNLGAIKLIGMFSTQTFAWAKAHDFLFPAQLLAFFLSFWVQMLFLYTLPLIMLFNDSLLQALLKNFRYLKRLFFPTSVCLLIGALFYLGLFYLELDLKNLATRISPEVIVVVLSGGILMTLVINLFVTTTSTLLFIQDDSTDLTPSNITSEAST